VPGPRFGPKAIVTVSAASLMATVAGSAAFAYQHYNGAINTAADGGLTKNRPAAAQANAAGQIPENILLVGSDSRDDGNNQYGGGKTGQGARSDTSILLHIYADHQHAVGISIPRDMMVDIPACLYDQTKPDGKKSSPQHNQFNAAFAVGDTAEGNIVCERDTIEQMSGIRIDHTVVVGFAAFANLTTDIGGVQVCVPQDVSDVNGDNITLHKGIQVVAGKTALDYVREREGLGDGSDIGRTRRQQAFLGSMIKKIETSGVLNNATQVSQLVNDAMKNAIFDKELGSVGALTDFAMSLKGVNPANIQFMTLPGHYSGARVEMDPASAAVIWNHLKSDIRLDGTNAAGNSGATTTATPTAPATTTPPTTTAPAISPASIDVAVRNGTTVNGLAGNVVTAMSAQGYNAEVSRVTTASTAVTTIVYGTSKQKEWADQLAATLFPGAKVASGGHGTQVIVTLGSDYAAAHPQPGSSVSGSTSSGSSTSGGTTGQPLPTAIANNSRTAADDICSGITQGFGAGTG
jgi:LCP family protein required for cell wall assembly